MDCLRAREIVSEAFDRGVASTSGVEEARAHCRDCEECKAFVEGLVALQRAPQPQAPSALVDGILERARLMAEHAEELPQARPAEGAPAEEAAGDGAPPSESPPNAAQPPAPVAWEPDIASPAPGGPRPKWWWVPRASAIAGAAAVAVFALVVSLQGFRALSGAGGGAPEAGAPAAAPTDSLAGAPSRNGTPGTGLTYGAGEPATKGQSSDSTVGGARYVAFEGHAYVWLGDRSLDRATLQVAGTLNSSLDTSAAPASRDVWRSSAYQGLVFLERTPGTYVAFRSVERTLKGKAFVLSTESGVTAYGQWPALPSRFTTPTASDGRPTFISAGKDETGLTVFAPVGASAEQGFAVAPGTSSSDPAGGNPNWTWWVPKP